MPKKNEPTERQCAVSRKVLPVDRLIRFVLDPEGRVVPDLKRRLPGRGVWITAAQDVVRAAEKEKKRVFGRGFKCEARVEPGLAEQLDALMEKNALQALSMTRKAGELITGFSKVEAALRRDEVAGLIHASDAAEDGIRKLTAVAASRQWATMAATARPAVTSRVNADSKGEQATYNNISNLFSLPFVHRPTTIIHPKFQNI